MRHTNRRLTLPYLFSESHALRDREGDRKENGRKEKKRKRRKEGKKGTGREDGIRRREGRKMGLCLTRCFTEAKALSTLSQKSATVAENGETTATVAALFCDSVDKPLRWLQTNSAVIAKYPSLSTVYDIVSKIRRLISATDLQCSRSMNCQQTDPRVAVKH